MVERGVASIEECDWGIFYLAQAQGVLLATIGYDFYAVLLTELYLAKRTFSGSMEPRLIVENGFPMGIGWMRIGERCHG